MVQRRPEPGTCEAQGAESAEAMRYRLLGEHLREVVFQLDGAGRITFLSPAWVTLTGQAVEGFLGRPLRELVHPDDQGHLQGMLEALVARDQGSSRLELRLQVPAGSVWVELSARGSPAGAGEVLGTLWNLTERKQLLQRLEVADRLAMLGLLTPGLAHEMNNPLAFMLANSDFLLTEVKEGAAPEDVAEWREVLGEVREGAERLRQLIGLIREFTRWEDNEEPVDLHRVLDAVVRLTTSTFRSRARVVKEYAPQAIVFAHEARLRQVFLDLLLRAAQALPEGHPEAHQVRIVTRQEAGSVVVEVCDTGALIPPERLPRVFDPLFAPQGPELSPVLSVCQELIQKEGGRITVTSTAGEGTVFRVTLPLATL